MKINPKEVKMKWWCWGNPKHGLVCSECSRLIGKCTISTRWDNYILCYACYKKYKKELKEVKDERHGSMDI